MVTKSYDIPQCGICLEDMLNNLSAIKCGHMYHTQW